MTDYTPDPAGTLCEPVARYAGASRKAVELNLNAGSATAATAGDIRVIELFAGVGGFRVGLERASERYKTVWSNQWEPSTRRQDASAVYCRRFGPEGHSNEDIAAVPTSDIPEADLLAAGFPCQDYSVATTLKNARGIEGKKGVLWWQIHRILRDATRPVPYLMLENVDRLIKSPAAQRGRDFALILASLADLGYTAEWRVINAADYGMPQRRRRTYITAWLGTTPLGRQFTAAADKYAWLTRLGVEAEAFPCAEKEPARRGDFIIGGDLVSITREFNAGRTQSPFGCAGVMSGRRVWTADVETLYSGPAVTLGDILLPEALVPADFYIDPADVAKWAYQKGGKTEMRRTREGYEYKYSEGAMAFPDPTDRPSRTIITGEGGRAASRFKHVVLTPSGRYRRLTPVELERLNMFPDDHTAGASDTRRAFLMGNALVTGIVERTGVALKNRM